MRRFILPSLSVAMLTIVAPQGAHAQSCEVLKAQLTKASKVGTNSKAVKRYSNAIKQQTKMIAKVKGDLQRYKCSSGNNAAACKKLTDAQKRMQANLNQLDKKRSNLSSGKSKARIARIKSKLSANNCYGNSSVINVNAQKQPHREENGVKIIGKSGGHRLKSKVVTLSNSSRKPGNYRTMCVRTCDGFFFPISSNTSPQSFERDELACKLMCPGTETNLFFHRSYDEESQDMISYRDQTPYADKEYAFIYRTKAPGSTQTCSCNMAAFYAEMNRREALLNGNGEKSSKEIENITSVIPATKQDPGEDPETISNLEGNLNDQDLDAFVAVNQDTNPAQSDSKNIRIVGPVFLQNTDAVNLK
jgi:hypothetical protein